MKNCTKCGKVLEDGAVICPECGTFFASGDAPKLEVVKPIGYIGRKLINLIPFVGPIVYFIMLCIWGADKTKDESFRNWAKAQLWWMLITIGILAVLYIVLLVFMHVRDVNEVMDPAVAWLP